MTPSQTMKSSAASALPRRSSSVSGSSSGDSGSFWDFEGLGLKKKRGKGSKEEDDDSISKLKLKERVSPDDEGDAWQRWDGWDSRICFYLLFITVLSLQVF